MSANESQIGGNHYKTTYEHWDLCVKIPLGYLEGCTTKHVSRWRKKLGIQDLQKALHYLDKLMEVATYDVKRNYDQMHADLEVERFVEANALTHMEYQYIFILCTYINEKALRSARNILMKIIATAMEEVKRIEEINVPGSPEDGGQHARMEIPDA
jgi:hypothetical protein